MITGSSKAHAASLNARPSRCHWKAASAGNPRRTAMRYAAAIRSNPPSSPGMMPATNNSTTDAPAITAYRIIGIEGGMITARVDADDVTAAANSFV